MLSETKSDRNIFPVIQNFCSEHSEQQNRVHPVVASLLSMHMLLLKERTLFTREYNNIVHYYLLCFFN